MMFFRSAANFLAGAFILLLLTTAHAQQDDTALRDVQLGMQGLLQTTKDPQALAQLMKDLQDPELMAEAKKMMEDPEYIKQMKALTGSKEYKDAMKQTTDMLSDPNKAAQAEAKFEHMQRVGNDQLKKGAAETMEQAMEAMANPEVMAEMSKMLRDPKFAEELRAMTKDPQFQNYMNAMEDMMKDPSKKRYIEEVTESVKAQL